MVSVEANQLGTNWVKKGVIYNHFDLDIDARCIIANSLSIDSFATNQTKVKMNYHFPILFYRSFIFFELLSFAQSII